MLCLIDNIFYIVYNLTCGRGVYVFTDNIRQTVRAIINFVNINTVVSRLHSHGPFVHC